MPINHNDSTPVSGPTLSNAQRSDRVDQVELSGTGTAAESWVALCARAAVEQDPRRLLELVKQINLLLDARRQRLLHETDKQSAPKMPPKDSKMDGGDEPR